MAIGNPPSPCPTPPPCLHEADMLPYPPLQPPALVAGESPVHPLCTPCAYGPITLTLRCRLPAVLPVFREQSGASPRQRSAGFQTGLKCPQVARCPPSRPRDLSRFGNQRST